MPKKLIWARKKKKNRPQLETNKKITNRKSSQLKANIKQQQEIIIHKYDIKTSNHEKRVQVQEVGNIFDIKRPATQNNLVHIIYIRTAISKLHENC